MTLLRVVRVYRRHRERHAVRHALLILVVAFAALTLGAASVIRAMEGIGFGDALWQVWQTVTTVGYGDGPSKTVAGRVVTVVYGTLGIVLLGQVFSLAIEHNEARREARRTGTMPSSYHGAHLIVGFPGEQRTVLLIEELRHADPDLPVCVVDATIEALPAAVRELPGVHFVRGPLTRPETYLRAGVERARSASIFPAEGLHSDADATTVVQIGLMKRLAPGLRVVYLMADIRNESLFEGLDASRVVYDMLFQAVVQEITDPGVSEAIESMLSNIRGANPKTVPAANAVGRTWGDLCGALHVRNVVTPASVSASIVPYALLRGTDADVSPAYAAKIAPEDRLVLLSNEDFDWPAVAKSLWP